ncbi:DUF3618 domain-containing protein [Streptomyces cinereoruber]|uniref:DUF3618 domain-containing protein n=1 Tax=Streptomyces cinereoruber TaxID=67260 RepID=UPI0036333A4C
MNHRQQHDETATDLGELREQAERTRDELGRTVEALAAKADVKAQAEEKVAAAREKAAVAAERAKEKAVVAADLVKEKTPDPVLEKAEVVAQKAKANRTPLVAATAALAGFLLVRRIFRGRRGRR